MKKFLSFLLIVLAVSIRAQEFKPYKNGLIYSPEAMELLTKTVDSLNLRYKSCEENPVFFSKCQALAHIVNLKVGNIKEARKDMENGILFDDFIKKYPKAEVKEKCLIIMLQYKDYDGSEVVNFEERDLNSDYGYEIRKVATEVNLAKNYSNTWLINNNDRSDYSEESVLAFYFIGDINSKTIPMKYAKMIGYADCLIDTTVTKMLDTNKDGDFEFIDSSLPKNWQKMSKLEKEILLDNLRKTHVMGFCSMDSRPRQHAANIALLAAETQNWKVFLKAHLDIMNDRFDRMTDGSYAQGGRQTYIKELEKLDINVKDLLLGISFRIQNANKLHYYGSISRIGRAISESEYKDDFKKSMIEMISDNNLDEYNRVLIYFLFCNFNYCLGSKEEKKLNTDELKGAVNTWPDYLKNKIEWNDEDK